MTIRVLIVDDEELVRTGLRLILESEPDLTVVGTASDGASAVTAVQRFRPNVVLMDIRMPGADGLAATRQLLRGSAPQPCKVVVLTTFDVDEHVYEALRAGASGFLLKDVPADQLVHAIRVAAAGEALLAPSVTRRLITAFTRRLPPGVGGPPSTGLGELTAREAEVLTKLGVRDRVQAVIVAFRAGLVPLEA